MLYAGLTRYVGARTWLGKSIRLPSYFLARPTVNQASIHTDKVTIQVPDKKTLKNLSSDTVA